jgi:hypothetical protein
MVRSLLHLIGFVVPLGLLLAGLAVLVRRLRAASFPPDDPFGSGDAEPPEVPPDATDGGRDEG